MAKQVRIGILGTLRGGDYINNFLAVDGVTITALCDFNPISLKKVEWFTKEHPEVKVFDNYDEFITSGLFDGVLLANYFYEHTPFAIKAMENGVHVLSECTPALTMAECVALCRAVERTGCKYMLAENYPFFACNLEMKRIFESGKVGRTLYCEGEYCHPADSREKNRLSPGRLHWRNWLPRPYYITHALAPVMHITGNIPAKVNAKSTFSPESLPGTACRVGDMLSIILCEMSDGSLARVTGCAAWGGHGNWYRVCGDRGNMENVRGSLKDLRIQYNDWQIPDGEHEVTTVAAQWYADKELNKLAANAAHGGGDFWVAYHFYKYIAEDIEPFFNVYRAVALSATAIQALRSSINGGAEYEVPDFTKEEVRTKYENDTDNPFPDADGNSTMPCCSHPDYMPSEADFANAEADWKDLGLRY